jgi:hypothetical protein
VAPLTYPDADSSAHHPPRFPGNSLKVPSRNVRKSCFPPEAGGLVGPTGCIELRGSGEAQWCGDCSWYRPRASGLAYRLYEPTELCGKSV